MHRAALLLISPVNLHMEQLPTNGLKSHCTPIIYRYSSMHLPSDDAFQIISFYEILACQRIDQGVQGLYTHAENLDKSSLMTAFDG